MNYTREEIEKMPAGKVLNAAIAEQVLGYVWLYNKRYGVLVAADEAKVVVESGNASYGKHPEHDSGCWIGPLDSYSTDIAAAWLVVEHLTAQGWHYAIASSYVAGTRAQLKGPGPGRLIQAGAQTAPLAICRAALLATPAAPATSEREGAV